MTRRRGQRDGPSELGLPRGLADELGRLYGVPGAVPRDVDEAVAEDSWAQLEGLRRRRRIRRWGQLAVVAAAIVLVVWMYEIGRGPQPSPFAPPPLAGVRDIDRNGRVDILDAFVLAKRIEEGGTLEKQWDFNHDGVVDLADVDVLALAAVRLNREAS